MSISTGKEWLGRNSKSLQGAAALCVIAGALLAGWRWVSQNYSSDLAVRVDWNQSTIPPDVAKWTQQVSELPSAEDLSASSSSNISPFFLRELGRLLVSPTGKRLHEKLGIGPDVGRLAIAIQNQTNETIPGIRIRVDRFRSFWQVNLSGDLLTEKEVEDFYGRVGLQNDSYTIVLPDLPPLPAHSLTVVSLYGDGAFSDVSLAAPGHTLKINKTFKVEDSWLFDIARRPLIYLLPIVSILAILGPFVFERVARLAVKGRLPFAVYDLSCEEAKAGRAPSALALLRKAFLLGYTDKEHARGDSDLAPLRDLPEFKTLVGSP